MRYKDIARALGAAGFVLTRRKGSSCLFTNIKTAKKIVVPDHGTKDIALGTLKSIEKVSRVILTK